MSLARSHKILGGPGQTLPRRGWVGSGLEAGLCRPPVTARHGAGTTAAASITSWSFPVPCWGPDPSPGDVTLVPGDVTLFLGM